ncbi:hypothetical protein NPIL_462131 [Nephila pilipes]|uniref:Uncharacterized protein n=1 Tax=Nephila pilipes TaxID=299642 RepID=A0A8X6K267_NEPPI|nr:hypothetical protein NPIL_462131 [Nephila pilipes]
MEFPEFYSKNKPSVIKRDQKDLSNTREELRKEKNRASESKICTNKETFDSSKDNEEYTSNCDNSDSSNEGSVFEYQWLKCKIKKSNCEKKETSSETEIFTTENQPVKCDFPLPTSIMKSEGSRSCSDAIFVEKEHLKCPGIECNFPDNRGRIEVSSESSSDTWSTQSEPKNKPSEMLSRSLRNESSLPKQKGQWLEIPSFEQGGQWLEPPPWKTKGPSTEPSTSKQKRPRNEFFSPIQAELSSEPLLSTQRPQRIEPDLLPRSESFLQWRTGQQSPLLAGTNVLVFKSSSSQSSPGGSYTLVSSGRESDDREHVLEDIRNDYDPPPFDIRRRQCLTRPPRIRSADESQSGLRKRIRKFFRDAGKRLRNFF